MSVLTFVPTIEDAGKFLSCHGSVQNIPDSEMKDEWKLDIHREFVSIEILMRGDRKWREVCSLSLSLVLDIFATLFFLISYAFNKVLCFKNILIFRYVIFHTLN